MLVFQQGQQISSKTFSTLIKVLFPLLLLASMMFVVSSKASTLSLDTATVRNEGVNLKPYFQYLKHTNAASISSDYIKRNKLAEDLLLQGRWQDIEKHSFNNFENHLWLKTQLYNSSDQNLELTFVQKNTRLDRFDVFIFSENQLRCST